jgi:zinc transporter ZupT
LAFAFHSKGTSKGYSFLLSLLMAIPSMMVFSRYACLLEYGMGISAGCMLYAVLYDILPEALEHIRKGTPLTEAGVYCI